MFTVRGNATVTNLNSGAFTATQEPLTRVEREQLKRLAESDQFYRLKSVVTGHDGTQTTFLTSSKAVSVVHFLGPPATIGTLIHSVSVRSSSALWPAPS